MATLALSATALGPCLAGAQGAPAVQPDSAARARPTVIGDTIKAALALAPVPMPTGVRDGPSRWNREALFASGALTLGEFLSQIPGATLFTTGFVLAPAALAWHGDAGAVRVFIDGIERDEVTLRTAGVTDFALLPLWSLEEVAVEETAGELRVHARTWRVDRTTPSTRTDVLTGSENLNLFRGYFGRRAANGLALQVAAQQLSTASVAGMDGDALGGFARLGWAGGGWSVDATTQRQGINRGVGARYLLTTPEARALPGYRGRTSLSYLRVAWRLPTDSGPWAQVVASTVSATLESAEGATGATGATADTTSDSTASRAQYVVLAGHNLGALRLTAGARVRGGDSGTRASPLARVEYAGSRWTLSALAERRAAGTTGWDARLGGRPLEWIRLAAGAGATPDGSGRRLRQGAFAEAAVRVRERWLGVGARQLAGGVVSGLGFLDTVAGPVNVAGASALTANASGPVWRGWQFRSEAVRWNAAAPYRPQTTIRSKIWFASAFAERFPNANFHLLASLSHEYRGVAYLPKGTDPIGQSTRAYSVFGSLLEVRIASAVVSWDYRNLTGLQYETFPGYLMPRIASVYGIRWDFWN